MNAPAAISTASHLDHEQHEPGDDRDRHVRIGRIVGEFDQAPEVGQAARQQKVGEEQISCARRVAEWKRSRDHLGHRAAVVPQARGRPKPHESSAAEPAM
jgi:hypothetical protein